MERFVATTGCVTESNQSLCRSWDASLDENVVGLDFAIVEETTGWCDRVVFCACDAHDALVVFSSLVVTSLTTLTDGLSNVSVTESTHVTVLSSLLGVLVRLQLTTESLDDTLPSVSFGDCNDVSESAFFESVSEGVLFAEFLLCIVELVADVATVQTNFHDS